MPELRWLSRLGEYKVVRREIPRPAGKPYYLNGSTLVGVLHTTGSDTVESAWRGLNKQNVAPHFIAGENTIVQCRPLNVQASALQPGKNNSANVHAQVQLEMVASSKQKLWLPPPSTLVPTVAILAFCKKALGIPLRVPNNWPDDCSDVPPPWAANNRRRRQAQSRLWPAEKGWWMHMEVPFQGPSWHWDCGALRRTTLLTMAGLLAPSIEYAASTARHPMRRQGADTGAAARRAAWESIRHLIENPQVRLGGPLPPRDELHER
ncbi:MAG: hypothetical protein ACRD2T_02940 [Thermoanaerobaculia bacterium]